MIAEMIPDIFKYNAILSLPLFAVIELLLIRQAPAFSFSTQTISKSIYFLEHSRLKWIFKLNFVLKALIDAGFTWYLVSIFRLSYSSPLFWMLVATSVCFASLSYFTDDKFHFIHKLIIYAYGVLSALIYIYVSYLVGDRSFILATYGIGAITSIVAFYFMLRGKTNVYVQIVCVSIMYIWLIYFVLRYL